MISHDFFVYKEPHAKKPPSHKMQRTLTVSEELDDTRQMRFTICCDRQKTLTIEAHDRSLRMKIPEGGLLAMDTINISFAFGVGRVRGPWLAAQLNRPELEGAAGPYVAELATLYGVDMNRIADHLIRAHHHHQRVTTTRTNHQPLQQLHPVEDSLPDDYFCVVCQNSSEETEEEEKKGWVTIGRCSSHRFHRCCVEDDRLRRRETCMVCGMRL